MDKPKQPLNTWIRFSAIGMQMGAIIAGGAWLGNYLDNRNQNETPVWTLVCTLSGVAIGLYLVIKEVIQLSKRDEQK
jgi:ATP synthase protein I